MYEYVFKDVEKNISVTLQEETDNRAWEKMYQTTKFPSLFVIDQKYLICEARMKRIG